MKRPSMRVSGLAYPTSVGVSRGAGSRSMVPVPLENLSLWLDAERVAPGIKNGAAVAIWHDQSVRGSHVSQATSSKRPTYLENQRNGRPVVRFSRAATQYLDMAANLADWRFPHDGTGCAVYLAFATTVDMDALYGLVYQTAGSGGNAGIGIGIDNRSGASASDRYSAQVRDGTAGSTIGNVNDNISQLVWHVVWMTARPGAGLDLEGGIDAVSLGSDTGGTAADVAPTAQVRVGGLATTETHCANMDLGELLIFRGYHDLAQTLVTRKYLGARWGVAVL